MDNESIIGTCPDMCPAAEIRDRERAGLVHIFEKLEGHVEEPVTNTGGRGRGRGNRQVQQRGVKVGIKADKAKTVKAYTRPAAGVNKTTKTDLRPVPVLKKTVAYLCLRILPRTDFPFIEIYDFVFDRLRAVRQDMVVQRINDNSAIVLLESIVKFHLYAEYKFLYKAPVSYDPCINQKHLGDCLKTLLSLYGYNEYLGSTRAFFEALYCLNSPESYEVISRAFEIREIMKNSPVFIDSLEMCLAIQKKNFYKFFQLLDELPPLLAAYAVQRVRFMRTYALKALMVSYGVQTCKIPLEWLEEILCYQSDKWVKNDISKTGSQIIEIEGVKFVKFMKSSPFLNNEENILDNNVKWTILTGLNNVDVITKEQICPWGQHHI